ncbi:ParA family protein [Chitinivorax tropicus]|uniref:ParA family protein n=1 Tax=Chitinivorax tropicus TaxID=714531 RepID=UPI001C85FB57|nr:ParA family protein [Chitinivorax tropicus]
MTSILIANPKGGAGKSTLATNLATYFAWQSQSVMLGDVDQQQSSRFWLGTRPGNLPAIQGWCIEEGQPAKPPKGVRYAVLDTPAGLHGKKLETVLKRIDRILVPVQPSAFDMWASRAFFEVLAQEKAIRKQQIQIGVVGMRVDQRTRSAQQLADFLAEFDLPVLGCLRETQLYVKLAGLGMGIFDLAYSQSIRDREQWQPIVDWCG